MLDPVGGDVFTESFRVLKPLGTAWRSASPAAGGSRIPAPLVGRNLGLQGFYLGRLMRHDPELVREAIGELLEAWSSGAVKPLVGATFPLEEAGRPHELIESRRHVGKVVLVPETALVTGSAGGIGERSSTGWNTRGASVRSSTSSRASTCPIRKAWQSVDRVGARVPERRGDDEHAVDHRADR